MSIHSLYGLPPIELSSCALAKAFWTNLPGGHQKMHMMVALVAVPAGRVDRHQDGDLIAINQELP